MRPVHRSQARVSKCCWCAAASLPLAADWRQQPLTPMPPAAAGGETMTTGQDDLNADPQVAGRLGRARVGLVMAALMGNADPLRLPGAHPDQELQD